MRGDVSIIDGQFVIPVRFRTIPTDSCIFSSFCIDVCRGFHFCILAEEQTHTICRYDSECVFKPGERMDLGTLRTHTDCDGSSGGFDGTVPDDDLGPQDLQGCASGRCGQSMSTQVQNEVPSLRGHNSFLDIGVEHDDGSIGTSLDPLKYG